MADRGKQSVCNQYPKHNTNQLTDKQLSSGSIERFNNNNNKQKTNKIRTIESDLN